jgi:hypothetical protein
MDFKWLGACLLPTYYFLLPHESIMPVTCMLQLARGCMHALIQCVFKLTEFIELGDCLNGIHIYDTVKLISLWSTFFGRLPAYELQRAPQSDGNKK